jgi:hypothetical protein
MGDRRAPASGGTDGAGAAARLQIDRQRERRQPAFNSAATIRCPGNWKGQGNWMPLMCTLGFGPEIIDFRTVVAATVLLSFTLALSLVAEIWARSDGRVTQSRCGSWTAGGRRRGGNERNG